MASEAEAATVARGPLAAQPSGSDGGARLPGSAPSSSAAEAQHCCPQRRSRRRRATGTPRGSGLSSGSSSSFSASSGLSAAAVEAKVDRVLSVVLQLVADLRPMVESFGPRRPLLEDHRTLSDYNVQTAPYSRFSNPVDAVYEKGSDTTVARKEKQLDESFQRLEKIPKLLEAKAGEKGHHGHEGDGDGRSDPYSASGRRLALLAVQQPRGRRLRLESFKRLEKIPKLLETKAGEEGHTGLAALRQAREHGVPLGSEGCGGVREGERVLPGHRGHRHDGHEGDGGGLSDPYSANDADAVSPHTQFSNPEDAIYERGVARKQKRLDEYFQRLEKIPKLLEAKAGVEGHPGPAALRHARGHSSRTSQTSAWATFRGSEWQWLSKGEYDKSGMTIVHAQWASRHSAPE